MVPYSLFLSAFSVFLVLSISFTITARPASALPDNVFWDNDDWPSDLEATDSSSLLEGTVLFAQSQVIPSKHSIENDTQPHLTALRKALVMLRPHKIDDKSVDIELIVRDAGGNIVSGDDPIIMKDPEKIPKQDGWIELGKVKNIEIPSSLDDAFVVQGQSNLDNIIGGKTENVNLANIFNTYNNEVEVRTWNGSWVKKIFLPSGSEVPEGSKFQITCDSVLGLTIIYPRSKGSSLKRWKKVSKADRLVFVMVSDVWVAEGDPKPAYLPKFPSSLNNPFVVSGRESLNDIGNDPESAGLTNLLNDSDQTLAPTNEIEIRTRNGSWVKDIYLPQGSAVPTNSKIQVTCNSGWSINVIYPNTQTGGWRTKPLSTGDFAIFILNPNNNAWLSSDDLAHNEYIFGHNFYTATLAREWVEPGMTLEFAASSGERGVLDAEVGGLTELVITTLDAGFLTEPRNEFVFREDPTSNTEYFETTPASRLVVVQYETMHFEEIMLPTGELYTTMSDDEGGVHSGDMRQVGKILLSHGIDLANYGISSSLGQSESSHPFTCAFLAAHNTVGMYQNGRIVHGLSGGNGMITLKNSIGNEMSHEVGHNYGLGHYVGGFHGSVHRPADELNSSWGWDSQKNVFIPNFSQSNTGNDQCLDEICQSPFDAKYQYGKDAMAGGAPLWGSNRFTLYTPYVSNIIQTFLESKAIWDPSSSTGFRKYNSTSRQMEEFTNNDNAEKVPRLYRVPVTTVLGYYDPNPEQPMKSYIYPALHGAYGFVYNDDGGSSTGTSDGCELVVNTKTGTLVFELDTTIDPNGMRKFHVNVATEDEPDKAWINCYNQEHTSRELEGPKSDEPLTFSVNGAPFADDVCKDKDVVWSKKNKNCDWVGKKATQRRCSKSVPNKGVVWDLCPETCGRLGLGRCKNYLFD